MGFQVSNLQSPNKSTICKDRLIFPDYVIITSKCIRKRLTKEKYLNWQHSGASFNQPNKKCFFPPSQYKHMVLNHYGSQGWTEDSDPETLQF